MFYFQGAKIRIISRLAKKTLLEPEDTREWEEEWEVLKIGRIVVRTLKNGVEP